MLSHRALARGLAVLVATAVVASTIDVALAAFGARAANGGSSVTAASDYRAPVATATAVAKASGGVSGFVKQGGGYHVYANVAADTGSPASGIAAVTANLGNLTTGATAVPLVSGSYSTGGVSYGYRSGTVQTASAVLSEGAKSFTVTAVDSAANANVRNDFATVDNTPPLAADVQTVNGGGTGGLAEAGDSLRLTFSEPIDPQSIVAGWNGAAANIVVRLVDSVLLGLGADAIQLYNAANTTALPLGQVQLGRSDYLAVGLSGNVRFGASGTPSTMAFAGNTLVVTLGTYNSTLLVDPSATTAAGNGTMAWTPVATPYDRAQNTLSTATATESGAADRDF